MFPTAYILEISSQNVTHSQVQRFGELDFCLSSSGQLIPCGDVFFCVYVSLYNPLLNEKSDTIIQIIKPSMLPQINQKRGNIIGIFPT